MHARKDQLHTLKRAPKTLYFVGSASEFQIFRTSRHDHHMLRIGVCHLGQHVFRNENRRDKNPPALRGRLTIFFGRHNFNADLGRAWKISISLVDQHLILARRISSGRVHDAWRKWFVVHEPGATKSAIRTCGADCGHHSAVDVAA